MSLTCPTCGGTLVPYNKDFNVTPKPDKMFICTGTCKAAIGYHEIPGEEPLLASFQESQFESWREFTDRKLKERREAKCRK